MSRHEVGADNIIGIGLPYQSNERPGVERVEGAPLPGAGFGGEYFYKDLYEMAAAYLFHLARNHAFVDGNKRTALASCLVFLDFNGIEIDADPLELENMTIAVAEGQLEKPEIS